MIPRSFWKLAVGIALLLCCWPSVASAQAVIKQPGAIFSTVPQRSMLWAEYMARIGLIKTKPASWKDYTFPFIHDRNGS